MSRKCQITGKGVLSGNNVSHSNRKIKRKFRPNVQNTSFFSEILGKRVSFKATPHGLRVIEANYGLDQYLLNARVSSITDKGLKKVRKMLLSAQAARAAAEQ